MIRKAVIVVLMLGAGSTTVIWFNQFHRGGFSHFPDEHFMGFAMTSVPYEYSGRIINYNKYPSVAIPIQWQAYPQYNRIIVPLWSLLVVFWCYPIKAFLHRAKRRRYVEREWFAIAAGMLAFAIAALAVIYFLDYSNVYREFERLIGSGDTALAVFLILLVVVPAISALATHKVFAGRLRRASQRKPKMCVVCTYNLTGNVSGVCPECGTKIESR